NERGPDDLGIHLFLVETDAVHFWFEVEYEFAENQTDFWVVIRNFGLHRRSAAGSKPGLATRRFNVAEGNAAQAALKALFLGPPENERLPFFPFKLGRSRCLGVKFPD